MRTRAPAPSRRHLLAGRFMAAVLLVTAGLVAGCDESPLKVQDPTVLTPESLSGPTAVPTRLNGAVRAFAEAYDSYLRYETYITDEMIATGTITDRTDVDFRDVQADNVTLTDELYEPMQTARQLAEDMVADFQEHLDDADYADVKGTLQQGIALGNLYAGYLHLMFGELYCRSVIDSLGSDVSSDQAVQAGVDYLAAAGKAGTQFGIAGVPDAARVGQARGLVWLGDYAAAADTASVVGTDFDYQVEYSSNTYDESNELLLYTVGVGGPDIRWTVGDGTAADRDHEIFTYFDEWVSQGLIQPHPPGLVADAAALPVNLQLLYTDPASNILLATGWEARMIEAENELRNGDPEQAQSMVNALLTDPSQAHNPMLAINPGLTQSRGGGTIPAMAAFDSVDFTGDLATDLPQLARAREAGLWLSGTRQGTLRRLEEDDAVDLYPVRRGTDVCLPIPQQESDNNPNVGG